MLPHLKRLASNRTKSKSPRTRRLTLAALVLPPIVLALFGLSIAYRIYASNRAENSQGRFPYITAPHPPQSILVFAPHPDDETLGAAGMIRESELNGCVVHLVVMTNGDAFRVAAARQFNEITVSPADFVRFGYVRQTETVTALGVLLVPANHIQFLGYPDRGLMPMWTTNWSPDNPYRSPYTNSDHNPYKDVLTPGAPYCGESVMADVRKELEKYKPTDIYVTHPDDDHPDHAATSVFVASALQQMRDSGEPWAQHAQIHYYLVHRGDWPVPQGLDEDFPMGPPAPMSSLDTNWQELKLSKRDIQRKYAAVRRYESQTRVTSRFMYSFVKRNELFGTLQNSTPAIAVVPDHTVILGNKWAGWPSVAPLILDPVADSVLPSMQPGGDIQYVYICRDSRNLYLRVETNGPINPKMVYRIVLRPVDNGLPQSNALILSAAPRVLNTYEMISGQPKYSLDARGKSIEISIKLSDPAIKALMKSPHLYVAADTYLDQMRIDKTGFRCVNILPNQAPLQLQAVKPVKKITKMAKAGSPSNPV